MTSDHVAEGTNPRLVVALSSRALFDFEYAHQVFQSGRDEKAYMEHQLSRIDEPAARGAAFHLARKLMAFNSAKEQHVELVILSRNDPVSGLRVFKSADVAELQIQRGVFTHGRDPFGYLRALGATLFLSASDSDVRGALGAGVPAARVYPVSAATADNHPGEMRIAFDGDAVLFSDQAEKVYQGCGLTEFQRQEREKATEPLAPGPFKPFLEALHRLQNYSKQNAMKIRTALVTARNPPAHERAIRTLMAWNVVVDEAMFLGGVDKAPFLAEFQPDFFFDDQARYCETAACVAPTGHVAFGVASDSNNASNGAARRLAR